MHTCNRMAFFQDNFSVYVLSHRLSLSGCGAIVNAQEKKTCECRQHCKCLRKGNLYRKPTLLHILKVGHCVNHLIQKQFCSDCRNYKYLENSSSTLEQQWFLTWKEKETCRTVEEERNVSGWGMLNQVWVTIINRVTWRKGKKKRGMERQIRSNISYMAWSGKKK